MNLDGRSRLLQLAPEVVDMNGDRVGFDQVIDPIELVLEDRLGHYTPETPHQLLERGGLSSRQENIGPVDDDLATDRVEREIARVQDGSERPAGAAQQRLDARNQF